MDRYGGRPIFLVTSAVILVLGLRLRRRLLSEMPKLTDRE